MIRVRNLCIDFPEGKGLHRAVNGFALDMAPGEIMGLVGESGSGKTQSALALMGLSPASARVSGSIELEGRALLGLPQKELRRIQGKEIAMIFQQPMTSLDPTMRIGRQVEEALRLHTDLPAAKRREQALQAMRDAELPQAERLYDRYPHELSGGMRQRVMIAAAIVARPRLLIADEPTTALDVTIQAQILALLKRLNQERGMAILFISHDLGVIRRLCRNVTVMQGGRVVETGSVEQIFRAPTQDYTRQLIAAIPSRKRGEV